MNLILVRAVSVGRRVVEQAVKRLSSGSWNGKEKSTPRSSQMPPNGVPRQTFLLHLKECEFRFNHREEISLIEY